MPQSIFPAILRLSNNMAPNSVFDKKSRQSNIPQKIIEEEKKESCNSNNTQKTLPNIIQANNEKKLKHRVFIIQEILKTEENYMNILLELINTVILPCQELKYLNKTQEKEIFSNIETIAKFSEKFYSALKEKFDNNFDTSKTLFAETIVRMQPFFRFYYPYCINYQDARWKLEEIRKDNPQFNIWLKNIEMEKWDKVIDSVLIEPVQRLPRLLLLLKELRKNTDISHPDYKYIEQALKSFEELNSSVNKNMEEYIKGLKLFELAEKYKKHFKHELIDPKRKFLEEEAMTLITDGATRQVVCYFLSDMLLVTEHSFTDMKLIKYLHFDAKSYVYDMPNAKHYNHLITICGLEEGLTFILDSSESKTKILQFFTKTILSELKMKQSMYKNSMSCKYLLISTDRNEEGMMNSAGFPQIPLVYVNILGSVKRGLEKLTPYIVYFIRVKYGKYLTDLFLRYRELKTLDDYVKSTFSEMKDTSFPSKKIFHQETKTIEGRKLDMENFLRVVLNSEHIKAKPEMVLKFLNLPQNFYELNDIAKDESFFLNLNDVGEKLLRRFSVFRVLHDFFLGTRPIYSISKIPDKMVYKEIEIQLPDESRYTVPINKYTKGLDLCYELAQKIGLISWMDYKLILEKSDIEERVIDDDEFVFKALNIDDIMMENPLEEPSLFEKMYEKFQKGQVAIKELFRANYRLKWKKSIYLSPNIENIDYMKDSVKLNLMVCQIFLEISQKKFELSKNDYSLFAALYAFLFYGNLLELDIENSIKFIEEKIVNKIIPIEAFLKEDRALWMNAILIFWKKFSVEISKIIDFNRFLIFL